MTGHITDCVHSNPQKSLKYKLNLLSLSCPGIYVNSFYIIKDIFLKLSVVLNAATYIG